MTSGVNNKDYMHFVRDGFISPSLRVSPEWDSETSGEKSISHGKPHKMHFLAYFTLQGVLMMLKIYCSKLKIMKTNSVIDLSHNCSQHGGSPKYARRQTNNVM